MAEKENVDDTQPTEQENYWSLILGDVAVSSARVGPSFAKNVLVLGNVTSGKTTLVDKLCEASKTRVQNPNGLKQLNGCSLEYKYVDVREEDMEDSVACMDIWVLDGVQYQEELLQYVLSGDRCSNALVVIAVDMSRPWDAMDSLHQWTDVIRTHLDSLKIPAKEFSEMSEAVVQHFQNYTDPEADTYASLSSDLNAAMATDPSVALPLDDSVLTHNLGIPLVVVCCKTDLLDQLEKTHNYKSEHIDFIQQSIRNFCLNYGAALVYTAAKASKNISLLYKYLVHRAFGLPFKHPASVVDKDTVFIPSGWDSETKIGILRNHIQQFNPSSDYSNIIQHQTSTKTATERQEAVAQDDQVFLLTQKAHLDRTPSKSSSAAAASGGGILTSRSEGHHASSGDNKHDNTGDASKPGAQVDQKVLADFFKQLLDRKAPTTSSRGPNSGTKSPAAS